MPTPRVFRRTSLVAAGLLFAACSKPAPPAAADAGPPPKPQPVNNGNGTNTTAGSIDAGTRTAPARRPDAPETLFVRVSGASMRRALPMLFPEARGREAQAIEQLAPQLTPGVGAYATRLDLDYPFAAMATVSFEGQMPKQQMFVSWPLKPGSSVAQDARAKRGWRDEGDGMYSPTAPDAGAGADNTCWVAQREPVGWMLLCGPREGLAQMAPYLRDQANHPPDNSPILDLVLNPTVFRRVSQMQLAQLDMQPMPLGNTPMENLQRQALTQARRDLKVRGAILSDASTVHLSLTQDETSMHLRGEASMPSLTQDDARNLVAAATNRPAPTALLQLFPATVRAFYVQAFDPTGIEKVFGAVETDPNIEAQMGPEVAGALSMLNTVTNFTPLGTRATAFTTDDGGTLYQVMQMADAAAATKFLADMRRKFDALPPRPLAPGQLLTVRDIFALFPAGLDGVDAIRIGKRMPPGPIPEEQRVQFERSTVVAAVGDKIITVNAKSPAARYKSMAEGARLAFTMPANAPLAGRLTADAFLLMIFGDPTVVPDSATEPLDFALEVVPDGTGVKLSVKADASIGAGNQIRYLYAAYMAQIEQRMMAQQQAAQAAQGGGGGIPGAPGPGPQGMPGPAPQ